MEGQWKASGRPVEGRERQWKVVKGSGRPWKAAERRGRPWKAVEGARSDSAPPRHLGGALGRGGRRSPASKGQSTRALSGHS